MSINIPKAEGQLAATPQGTLPAIMDQSLIQINPGPSTEELFPTLKLVWPIEAQSPDSDFTLDQCYKVGVNDGSSHEMLPEGYTLAVIAARDATRRLIDTDEGKKYERAFAKMGKGESEEFHKVLLSDSTAQKGYSFILALFKPDGSAAVVMLDAFKSGKDYWGKPLHKASMANKVGLRVALFDHSCNLTATKKDKTKSYLDPKKFKQYEYVQLTEDQIRSVIPILEENKDKFQRWLDL